MMIQRSSNVSVENDRVAEVVRVAQIAEGALTHQSVEGKGSHPDAIGFSEDSY